MRPSAARGGKERSPLGLIFLTVFVDLVGFGIVLPLLPIFARTLTHGSEVTVGMLLASYSLVQFLFVPVLGRWSDRVGRKPVLIFSVLGSCVSFALMGYSLLPSVLSLPLLFASRILDGLSGANLAAAQAYIADVTPPEKRAQGMGILGVAFGLGFILGPAIGGVLTGRFGMPAPGFAAAALAGINTLLIWRILPESLRATGAPSAESAGRWAPLLRIARRRDLALPIFVFFLAQFAASVSQVAFPLFMSDPALQWRLDAASIGWKFFYIGVVVAAIQGGLIGRMVKRWGEVRLTWMGLVVLAGSYFLFPGIRTWAGLYGILAFMALGQGSIVPSLNGLVSRRAGPEEQGVVLGANQSMASLARVLGPLWAGWTYSLAPPLSYSTAAVVLVVAFVASLGFRTT